MKKTLKTISAIAGVISGFTLIGCTFDDLTIGQFLLTYAALIGVVLFSLYVCCYNDEKANDEIV